MNTFKISCEIRFLLKMICSSKKVILTWFSFLCRIFNTFSKDNDLIILQYVYSVLHETKLPDESARTKNYCSGNE